MILDKRFELLNPNFMSKMKKKIVANLHKSSKSSKKTKKTKKAKKL